MKLTKKQEEYFSWFLKDFRRAQHFDSYVDYRAQMLMECREGEAEARKEALDEYSRYNGDGHLDSEFKELKEEGILHIMGYNTSTLRALENKGYIEIIESAIKADSLFSSAVIRIAPDKL